MIDNSQGSGSSDENTQQSSNNNEKVLGANTESPQASTASKSYATLFALFMVAAIAGLAYWLNKNIRETSKK